MVLTLSRAPARRTLALRATLVVMLLLGYADLARGGITLGPLLLLAAYLVVAPIAILLD